MMARYIDADALIAEMHNVILEDGEDRRTFYEVIERQPTADVVERKKGKWLRYGNDWNTNTEDTVIWKCDHCLKTFYGRTDKPANYCPNCGADMRGEKHE